MGGGAGFGDRPRAPTTAPPLSPSLLQPGAINRFLSTLWGASTPAPPPPPAAAAPRPPAAALALCLVPPTPRTPRARLVVLRPDVAEGHELNAGGGGVATWRRGLLAEDVCGGPPAAAASLLAAALIPSTPAADVAILAVDGSGTLVALTIDGGTGRAKARSLLPASLAADPLSRPTSLAPSPSGDAVLWRPGAAAWAWDAGGGATPLPLAGGCLGAAGVAAGIAVLDGSGKVVLLESGRAVETAAAAAAGASPDGGARVRRGAPPSPPARRPRTRATVGGGGDAEPARSPARSPARPPAARAARRGAPADEGAIQAMCEAAAATGTLPSDALATLDAAGALAGAAGESCVGRCAVATADALPKHWAGRATAPAGADDALAAKEQSLARFLAGLDGAGALAALAPGALRAAFEARERVAAAASLRALLNRARSVGRPDGPLAAAVEAAGARALPGARGGGGGALFFSAPARALPALLGALPAAAAAALTSSDDAAASLDAVADLAAGAGAAVAAALAARAASRAAYPAPAALALRGEDSSPDWLSGPGARDGLTAVAAAAGSLLPRLAATAPARLPAAASLAADAAGLSLDAHARGGAAAAGAGPGAGAEGAPTAGEHSAAASSLLRPLLDAASALASSGFSDAASTTRDAVEALARAHGAHAERWAALRAAGDAARAAAALAEPPPRGRAPASAGTFADHAFGAMLAGGAPSELLELPASLNEAVRSWLAARGPADPAAARLAWLHDLRTRRYLGAAASLARLAGGEGVEGGAGGGVAAARLRAARLARLAAAAAADRVPAGSDLPPAAAAASAAADAAFVLADASAALAPRAARVPPAATLAAAALAPSAPPNAALMALQVLAAAPPAEGGTELARAAFARLASATDWAAALASPSRARLPDAALRAALAATPLAAGASLAYGGGRGAGVAALLPPDAALAAALAAAAGAGAEADVRAAFGLGLTAAAGG